MRYEVLGPLRVVSPDGRDVTPTAPKHRALLGVLLASRGGPVSTGRLIDELWPEDAPASASAALQVYVSALRKVLGDRLTAQPAGYVLALDGDHLDALVFEQQAQAIPQRASADDLAAPLQAWRGPAFDGLHAGPIISAARARLTALRNSLRFRWAEASLAEGRHAAIVPELSGWLFEELPDERLAGQLMLALYRCGRASEALALHDRVTAELGSSAALPPAQSLASLAAAIRRRDPTLEWTDPRVPSFASHFIGRRAELDQAEALLARVRLLTIVGPGGAGKTRLAYELARTLGAEHPDGVHVAELAGHPTSGDSPADVESLAARVAAAVGIRESPGEPVAAVLARRLSAGRALLVLDNCEHLRATAAALASQLLSEAAGLRILATSREPLAVAGEAVFPLSGLAVPPPGAPPDQESRCDAVRMLVARVGAARGGPRLSAA
jgi:DNA-binding SARP family transcriptional activator